MIGNVGAVFAFEWKRAWTWPRRMWWLLLTAFPVFIILIIRVNVFEASSSEQRANAGWQDVWRSLCAWLLFALIPMLVSMLGTLLWTTPAVSAELERRSWIYLAIRPNGGTAVLLGKYLAAVTWILPPALMGLTIAVLMTGIANASDMLRIWLTMVALICLAAPAYAAVYLLLGVIMPRRAMVLAVAYTLIFELVVSFIPAIINKITVQYHLRSLAAEWCDIKFMGPGAQSATAMQLIGSEPAWQHVATLVIQTIGMIALAVGVLRMKEFSSSAESDT